MGADVPLDSKAHTCFLTEVLAVNRVVFHREVQLGSATLVEGSEQDVQRK